MSKLPVLILSTCILLTGCQSSTTDASFESEYDRVSRQMEELREQAQPEGTGQNIRIVVNILTTNVSDYAAVDTLWQYVDQHVVLVKRPDIFLGSGLKIGLAGGNFQSRVDAVKRKLKHSEDTELFVTVSDSVPGYINIGQEITVPRFYYFGRWYRGVDYRFRRAGKSLKVIARRLPGGLIEMQLTPVFSRFLNTGGDIELTELTTTVTARPGQTVVLGGSRTAGENVGTALFSYQTGVRRGQSLLTVTPHIQ
ncbi:MAG: hypothetical protein GWP14_04470 [Actinobacteria bacterium]|nr:hypothetical protein [Actinomycetota bacterium]